MANLTSSSDGKEAYPKFLYHYTNLIGLEGILQKEKIVFHGTRYDSLNDPRDFEFARHILINELSRWNNPSGFEEIEHLRMYPYIVSFSELGDNLNLWRWYHSSICLVIDWEQLRLECTSQQSDFFNNPEKQGETDLIHFGQCEYTDDNIENIQLALYNLDNKVRIHLDDPADDLQLLSSFIKHNSFEGEKEWRLVKFDSDDIVSKINHMRANDDIKIDLEKPQRIKVKPLRSDSEDFILYKEFEFTHKILKGVLIRQSDELKFEKIKRHLILILKDRGYEISPDNIVRTQTYFQ